MGLKDKMLAKSAQITAERKGFTPLELNEGNVQAIFKRCVATADTPIENIRNSILFHKYDDDDRDIKPLSFSNVALQENFKTLQYLYGQLQVVQRVYPMITAENGVIKYNQQTWTTDMRTLMEFFHLGRASGILTPFGKDAAGGLVGITPTLSPKDPNFPAWWEEHEHEWEQ